MKKSINKTIKLIIMLSLVFLIGFSLLGCRHVVKTEQQIIIGTVIDKYSTVTNKCLVVEYNNKGYFFYNANYYYRYQINDKVKCIYEKTYFDNDSCECDVIDITGKIK